MNAALLQFLGSAPAGWTAISDKIWVYLRHGLAVAIQSKPQKNTARRSRNQMNSNPKQAESALRFTETEVAEECSSGELFQIPLTIIPLPYFSSPMRRWLRQNICAVKQNFSG